MHFYLNHNYYFITCRTFNKESLFINDEFRQMVLDVLLNTADKLNFKFEAYSILSNHYHLLFYLDSGVDLKRIMQMINGSVSYRLNQIRSTHGSVWDQYHNKNVIGEEAYYKVLGYILGNPFKHGLVENIQQLKDYKYCNYNKKAAELGEDTVTDIICKVKNLNWEINL